MTLTDPGIGAAVPTTASLSPLAAAILNYLQAEAGRPPLKPDSISRDLWQTGAGLTAEPIPVAVIDGALAELMAAGQVERAHSARLGVRYRAIASRQVGPASASTEGP